MPVPVDFPKGAVCSRIRLKAVFNLNKSNAGNYVITVADAVGLFQQIFGSTEIKFGDSNYEVIDDSIPFNTARQMLIAMSERDMTIGLGNTYVQLNALTATSLTGTGLTVPGTGNLPNVIFEFVRSFVYERSNTDIHEWCPGTTQMQTLRLQTIAGATPTISAGTVTITGSIAITVLFDTTEAEEDRWCRPVRTYRNSTSGLQQEGPGGGGGLLGLWETTQPASASTLTIFLLKRDNDNDLHNAISAGDVIRGQVGLLPPGTFDLNGLVTCLYFPDDAITADNIPTSTRWLFVQPGNDLQPPNTVWLFTPPTDESYIQGTMAQTVKKLGDVQAVNRLAMANPGIRPSTASISSVALLGPNHPNYSLSPGVRISSGQPPKVVIPPTLTKAAGATAGAHSGDAQPAALAKVTTAISQSIPGFTSPGRGVVTNGQQQVATHVVAGAAAGTQAGAQQASATLSALNAFRSRLFA
jgi:hypothetical protein